MLTANTADYSIQFDPRGFAHFTFRQITEAAHSAWACYHASAYLSNQPHLLLLVELQSAQVLLFAHAARDTKRWLAAGKPFVPTRHAYLVPPDFPTELVAGLVKTLPPVDIKTHFFPQNAREAAVNWLLSEQVNLLAAHTKPHYSLY